MNDVYSEFSVPTESPPPDLVQAFVAELALEFFPKAELPAILGITQEDAAALTNNPDVQAAVRRTALELRATGEGFKRAAARFAETLLPAVAAIPYDENAKASERLRAVELLASWAGYAPKNTQASFEINLTNIVNDASSRFKAIADERDYLDVTPSTNES